MLNCNQNCRWCNLQQCGTVHR